VKLKRKKKYKRYARSVPGDRIQIDTCKIKNGIYQYTAVDDCSRYRVLEIYERRNAKKTIQFLKKMVKEFPFPIQRIQSDRGTEFFAYDVQSKLADFRIKFRPIKPASPHLNGKVAGSKMKCNFLLKFKKREDCMSKRKYRHFTPKDRLKLYRLLIKGLSLHEIAHKVGFHKSTIYRELARNSTKLGYRPDLASQQYSVRRQEKTNKIEKNEKIRKYIIEKLQEGWSPCQISGRLKKEHGRSVISHEAI